MLFNSRLTNGFLKQGLQRSSRIAYIPFRMLSSADRFLDVGFNEKDEVKQLGARWDKDAKKWYVPDNIDITPFQKWQADGSSATTSPVPKPVYKAKPAPANNLGWTSKPAPAAAPKFPPSVSMDPTPQATSSPASRIYLDVPFDRKDEAKALGAFWDKDVQYWYIGPNKDVALFTDFTMLDHASVAKGRPKKSTPPAGSGGKAYPAKNNAMPAYKATPPANPATVTPQQQQPMTAVHSQGWGTPVSPPPQAFSAPRIYLDVPFNRKDEAKALGAFWDKDLQYWYIGPNRDVALFNDFTMIDAATAMKGRPKKGAAGAANGAPVKKQWGTAAAGPGAGTGAGYNTNYAAATPPRYNSKNAPLSSPSAPIYAPPATAAATSAIAASGSYPDRNDAMVIISIDTNGLPLQDRGQYLPYQDLKSYDACRIVRISYSLVNIHDFSRLESASFIIEPESFAIENTEFHGITLDLAKKEGKKFLEAAGALTQAMSKANHLLAHNTDFVLNVLKSELYRHGCISEVEEVERRQLWDSMSLTQELVGLSDRRGQPKKPSLKELVAAATPEESLPEQRNAEINNEFLRRSLQVLVNTNRFSLAGGSNNGAKKMTATA